MEDRPSFTAGKRTRTEREYILLNSGGDPMFLDKPEDLKKEATIQRPATSTPKASIPQNQKQNLMSKISSLSNNLAQLAKKKARIEFEIKTQSRALYGKREELKRLHKSTSVRLGAKLESRTFFLDPQPAVKDDAEVQRLLQESDSTLKSLGF